MESRDQSYIWQADDWPRWRYDLASLVGLLTEVSRSQGLLLGRLADVGMALCHQASLAALTEDVVKTSQIEGETLNMASVRSLIKAGLAHLWLVTLHPFDDGNGRIARAVGDLFLARADGSPRRFYSLSAQIQRERQDYYAVLERTQKGTLDVTGWLIWFLGALTRAVASAQITLDTVLFKARFWQRWMGIPMNARQVKLLNRLLDGFEGKLTSSKWAAIAKCSSDTALRDITPLLEWGVLKKSPGGGRSTGYELAD